MIEEGVLFPFGAHAQNLRTWSPLASRARRANDRAMASEFFSGLVVGQEPGHCGASSLSACMWILGFEASQRRIARAAGRPWSIYAHGLDEHSLRRAARAFGVSVQFLKRARQESGGSFVAALRRHLGRGLPAILLIDDFAHWVALVGYSESTRRFVVMDPNDTERAFSYWNDTTLTRRAWNVDPKTGEPPQYFALLTRRRDGNRPRWHVSDEFLALCATGSEETAEEMALTLKEMVHRAATRKRTASTRPLAELIRRREKALLTAIDHWAMYQRQGFHAGDLQRLLRDYRTVAHAARLRTPSGLDETHLVAQLTAVLTTFAWNERL